MVAIHRDPSSRLNPKWDTPGRRNRQQYLRRVNSTAYRFKSRLRSFHTVAMAAVMVMLASGTSRNNNRVLFDTDSKPIGVNSWCTACISDNIHDFIGEMRESGRAIKGFGGTRTMSVKIGTIVWRWCNDDGLVHRFVIPNSYYVQQGGVRLLSPHHLVKEQRDYKQ